MNWWRVFWIAWITVGVIAELIALLNKTQKDTLSEQVWHWMQLKFFAWFLAFFLVWLLVHWLSRGRWA